jgi:hypothetical protein
MVIVLSVMFLNTPLVSSFFYFVVFDPVNKGSDPANKGYDTVNKDAAI